MTFTYDEGGRRATEALTTGGQTYTVSLDYDDAGRTVQITYPDGTTLDRTYTDRGQLEEVEYESADVASFVYDDGGRETSRTFGNSLVTTTSYLTGENLIDTLSTSGVAGFGYAYDANKNRTAETVTGALSASSWTTGGSGFDADDRLVERNQGSGTLLEEWNLSDVGNWDTFTVNSTGQSRTHGDAHEILTVGAASIAHDSRGNVVTDEGGRLFGWDADNRLAAVDVDADTTPDVTYAWDGLMRRVSMTRGGTTLVFVSLGNDLLAEYTAGTAATSPLRNYVYGRRIDEPLAMIDASDTHYYHADASTSIRATTDSSGNVEELYRYKSYGAPTILEPNGSTVRTSSTVDNRFLFTAREFDDATTSTATQQTGWYHFRNRPYSPTLGRFPSRDPIAYIDGWSLYLAYFVPSFTDPTGECMLGLPPIPNVELSLPAAPCLDCWPTFDKCYKSALTKNLACNASTTVRGLAGAGCWTLCGLAFKGPTMTGYRYACRGACALGGLCAIILKINYVCPQMYNDQVEKCAGNYNSCVDNQRLNGCCDGEEGKIRGH